MSPTAVFRSGANALITGAASGVGLAVAKLCASHGMNLILVDNNKTALDSARTTLSQASKDGATVDVHELDVSSEANWKKLRATLQESSKSLDFLHLNAGIGAKSTWTDTAYFRAIFDTNLYGVVHGIATFLPDFQSQDPSRQQHKAIVITGSKQGITNPPGNPAYNASKAAVKTLAEHLSFDLAKSSPNTSVHLLVPGWTFTGLTGGGKTTTKPDGAWAPEQVADYLYQKMDAGKFYVICPDNDVDWETDRKRMTWAMGDIVHERPALSRWREETKEEAKKGIEDMKL